MKQVKISVILLCAVLAGCTSAQSETFRMHEAKSFETKHVTGVNWYLAEIRTPETVIRIDRESLNAMGLVNAYTLRFNGEYQIAGTAAPNLYTAPYGWGNDSTIGIGIPASTRLLTLLDVPLNEDTFLNYLERTTRWRISDEGELELFTFPNMNGVYSVMVFRTR